MSTRVHTRGWWEAAARKEGQGGRDSSPLIPVPVRVGKRTRTVSNLNKYTFQSGQTHFSLLTNSFCQLQTFRTKYWPSTASVSSYWWVQCDKSSSGPACEQFVNLKERKYILRTKVGSLVGEQEALKCEGW